MLSKGAMMRTTIIDDVKRLVELRIAYLQDQNSKEQLGDLTLLAQNLYAFFEKAIRNNELVAVVAQEQQKICAVALLSIVDRPPRTAQDSGRIGTIYNVYTYPEYRKRGMATAVMKKLLEEARKINVTSVDLLASEQGVYLYEKLGFQYPMHTYMRMKL